MAQGESQLAIFFFSGANAVVVRMVGKAAGPLSPSFHAHRIRLDLTELVLAFFHALPVGVHEFTAEETCRAAMAGDKLASGCLWLNYCVHFVRLGSGNTVECS